MTKRNLKLSPPWEEIHSMLQAFFASDSDIAVDAEISDAYVLGIACYNEKKFNALNEVLRKRYEFGGVTLEIDVYLPTDIKRGDEPSDVSYDNAKNIKAALEGNELFDKIVMRNIMSSKVSFCLFKKEVVQFYNDDLTDLYGYASMLAEDIARIIFNTEDINFCTDVEQE